MDNLEFVLAVAKAKTDKARTEARRRNDAYIELLREWAAEAEAEGDPAARAVLACFENGRHLKVEIPKKAKSSELVAVSLTGHPWPHLQPAAQATWRRTVTARKSGRAGQGECLSCGAHRMLLDSLPEPVKAGLIPVGTDRGRDAQLVSVNTPAQGAAAGSSWPTSPCARSAEPAPSPCSTPCWPSAATATGPRTR
ncbi:type I-C CRISPR-associated protein Cas8c/Csd1 [Nocardiopsis composta]